MFTVKLIGSAGQTVKTYNATNEDHANRLIARIRRTFSQGSSQSVKVERI